MPLFFDISEWNEQLWWNTGGTRDKKIYLSPDNELYYFKQSFKKGKRDYKYEFWSEIIASEIGKTLGIEILPYHLAIRGEEVGCLSKSMIKGDEELVEGGKYLQAFEPQFNPADIKQRYFYTFQLIVSSLEYFKLTNFLPKIIDTIVFDALIGNSDRHQENWAIIVRHSAVSRVISEMEKDFSPESLKNIPKFLRWLFNIYLVKGKLRPEISQARVLTEKENTFAPIYDSGCSFGRELDESKVVEMLEDSKSIENYILKGEAEIHWNSVKLSHFELINKLLAHEQYKSKVKNSLEQLLKNYDKERIKELIETIDVNLPVEYNKYKMPKERKELIFKIVDLRYTKLKELI